MCVEMKNRLIEMFDPLKESPQSFDSRVLSVCRNGPLPGETTWKARRDNERRSLLLQHMPEDFRLRLDRAFQPSKAEEATIHTLLTKMKEVCKEMKESGVQPEQQDLASSTKTEPNDEDSFKASDNPANIFHRLQQGPGATVLDFVYEIEEMLVRCGYSHDFGEALAKDRLVVGLRDGEMRRQLNEMMDTPGGVSYEWLRFHAIRLDGGDLGYEEPPRSNDLEPSQPQHSSCSEAPLLPPFDSNVPPPLPFASCNVLPSQPPTSCNEPPPLPPASGNEPPPLPPISCNMHVDPGENPFWRRFHKMQQRPDASVLQYVHEMEAMLQRCGYRQDVGEALAKDRLVVGLRDQGLRDQLGDLMDRPGGVSYDYLRFHAIRMDGEDPGYEEPPIRPPAWIDETYDEGDDENRQRQLHENRRRRCHERLQEAVEMDNGWQPRPGGYEHRNGHGQGGCDNHNGWHDDGDGRPGHGARADTDSRQQFYPEREPLGSRNSWPDWRVGILPTPPREPAHWQSRQGPRGDALQGMTYEERGRGRGLPRDRPDYEDDENHPPPVANGHRQGDVDDFFGHFSRQDQIRPSGLLPTPPRQRDPWDPRYAQQLMDYEKRGWGWPGPPELPADLPQNRRANHYISLF
ncbi:Filamentous hemagglutinin [Frankliniella fusca]|uniref:Filamentous hemagglutinin n=1 Tax=Frankliniella fusca TaxID=407009 RepID=A0AAE1LIY4_9NEOP|nr:Filamentous hemagglutinin [Frankliniella fusca]